MSINLKSIVFKSTDIDVRKMQFFIKALLAKTEQKVLTQSPDLEVFAQSAAVLQADWFVKIKKLTFWDLFGDPFKGLREETRIFAKQWELDPELIKLLG